MEKEKELYLSILLNGGATLTSDLKNALENVLNGFCVSVLGSEKKIKLTNYRHFKKELRKQQAALKSGYLLGIWINKNYIYFDNSIIIDNLEKAVYIAKLNKQLAIYNIKDNSYISTK